MFFRIEELYCALGGFLPDQFYLFKQIENDFCFAKKQEKQKSKTTTNPPSVHTALNQKKNPKYYCYDVL